MPFNSLSFILFFLLFTALFYSSENVKFKSFLLLTSSFVFYAYTNIFNLLFLLSTILVTYKFANKLIHSRKNLLLFIGILFILIQLFFAKYSNSFFTDYHEISALKFSYFNFLILPIGISFYSLQAISLLADVRTGKYTGDTSLKSVSLFLSFFPQSLSGPIHRASELIPQFSVTRKFNAENLIIGFKTMLWGYFCKLIIADKIAVVISPVFNSFHEYDGFSISISALLYSFQIYFDFWGYSLIAIGLGRVLGFSININFLNPYSAKSFKDFWHIWHITLSKWMRDYIYIPLGGNNQKHYLLFCIAIMITFFVSGYWHGATFNFILWGAAHAFLYLSEDLLSRQFSFDSIRLYKFINQPMQTVTFFILISLTWLIFRTDSFPELTSLLSSILSFSDWTITKAVDYYGSTTNLSYIAIVLTTISFAHTKCVSRLTDRVPVTTRQTITDSIFVCICLVTIILLGDIGGQEFLYFRF
jgi:alginate O-acetyltransferase complex protein AlgI